MEKYKSYHFSPLNNRSMLMPRIPKGTKYTPGLRLKLSFEAVSPDRIDPQNPYAQINVGFFQKEIEVDGARRTYAVYVPDGMTSKGAAALVFPDSGATAEEFLKKENWKELSDRYHTAFIMLESKQWDLENVEKEFDYAWKIVDQEFGRRSTVDICESFIYPIGLGDGAYVATAFTLTYSATFPAFAADGNCAVDPALFEALRRLPSDGIETLKKPQISIPGFVVDRSGRAEATFAYMRETIRAKEEGLTNGLAKVYLEQPKRGAYYVNEQPIAQVWIADEKSVAAKNREELNEEMLRFVSRFARWGGFGNNHLRPRRSIEDTGVKRVYQEIDGLKRYWDVYVPSCYRPDDGEKYPLVVAIHGFSCNSEYFAQTSDWYRLAEERGFFVTFASAYPRNEGRSPFPLPGWSVWPMASSDIDETVYFEQLLDNMETTYNIDKSRVYAVGHSNGGRMTQALTRSLPGRFAAFGPSGSLAGSDVGGIEPISGGIQRPIWFIMGEYDLFSADVDEGSVARATLEAYCHANNMQLQMDNWYDNGNYHTLVMYDDQHIPMVQYTIMRNCPHTYTAEMAQLTWDVFLCRFSREPDGSVKYSG